MIRKSFITALLVAVCLFAAGIAQAVQVDGLGNTAAQNNGAANVALPVIGAGLYANPGGMGDALIFGYYNAKAGINFMRIVNTSTSFGVAYKVRFREGGDSNEVLDFFVCASAGDQFSMWLSDLGSGPAKAIWWDNDTPTFPDPQNDNLVSNNTGGALVTVNFADSTTGAASVVTQDRAKEGYVEVIGVQAWADTPGTNKRIKLPNECAFQLGLITTAPAGFTRLTPVDVPNSLIGNMYFFQGAMTYTSNATALANFNNAPIVVVGLATDNAPLISDGVGGINAVNYVLGKSLVRALYAIEDGFEAGADVLLTFPTKRQTIVLCNTAALATANCAGELNGPFNDNIVGIGATGAITCPAGDTTNCRCERFGTSIWNDEEGTTTTQGCLFSPCTPQQVIFRACNEVSDFTVGVSAASVVGSQYGSDFSKLDIQTFKIGWIDMDLKPRELSAAGAEKLTARQTIMGLSRVFGLPVIGTQVQSFLTGDFGSMAPVFYDTIAQ